MSIQTTVAAATIQVLSHEDKSAAYDQGGRYARSKLETLAVAQDAARTLGTDPSFDRWENYRIEWIAGGVDVAGVPRGSSRHKKTRRIGRVEVRRDCISLLRCK